MRTLRFFASVTVSLALAVPVIVVACGGGSSGDLTGGSSNHPDAGSADDSATPLGNQDAPSEYVPDANFDAALPLNTVDANDIPEGGTPVKGGVILCGGGGATCNAFAGNQCCSDDEGGACLSVNVICPTGGGSITCNESADCIQGDVCCGDVVARDAGVDDAGQPLPAPTPYVNSQCSPSCKTTLLQLCRTNGECDDAGPCVRQSCPDGRTYELCGVYSTPATAGGPTFACTPL